MKVTYENKLFIVNFKQNGIKPKKYCYMPKLKSNLSDFKAKRLFADILYLVSYSTCSILKHWIAFLAAIIKKFV